MATFDINKSCYLCLNEYKNLIDVRDKDSKDFYGIEAKLKYVLPELLFFGQDVKVRLCCKCLVDVTLLYIFKVKCIKSNDDLYRHLKKKQKNASQNSSGENFTNENQSKDGGQEEERAYEESQKIRKVQKMWNTPEDYQQLMNNFKKILGICRLPSSSNTIVSNGSVKSVATKKSNSTQNSHAQNTPNPAPNYVKIPNKNLRVDPTHPTMSQSYVSLQQVALQNIFAQKYISGNMSFEQYYTAELPPQTASKNDTSGKLIAIKHFYSENNAPQNTNSSPKPQHSTDLSLPSQNVTSQNLPPTQESSSQNIPSQKVPAQTIKPQNVPSQNLSTFQERSHQNIPAQNTKSQSIHSQNLLHNISPLQNVSPSQTEPIQTMSFQNLPQEKERTQNNFSQHVLPQDTRSQNLLSNNLIHSQNWPVQNKPSETVPSQKIVHQNSNSHNVHSQNLSAPNLTNEETQNVSRRNVSSTNVTPHNNYAENGHSQYIYYQNIPEAAQNTYHKRYLYDCNNAAQNCLNQSMQAQNVHPPSNAAQNMSVSHRNLPYNSNQNLPLANPNHQNILSQNVLSQNRPAQNVSASHRNPLPYSNYNWSQPNYNWQRQNMQYQNTNYQNVPQNGTNWYPQNLPQSQSTSFNNYNNSYWSKTLPPQNGQTKITHSQNVHLPQTVENSSSDSRMSQNPKENNQRQEDLPQNNLAKNPNEPIVIDDNDGDGNNDIKQPKDEFISLDFTHTKDSNYSEQPNKKVKLEPSELLFDNLNSSENYEHPDVKLAKLKLLEDNIELQENQIVTKDNDKVNHKTMNLVPIENLLNKNEIEIDPSKIKVDEIIIPKPEDKVSNSFIDSCATVDVVKDPPDQNLSNPDEYKMNDIENENKLFHDLPQKLDTKDILKQDNMLKSCIEDSLTLKLLLSNQNENLENEDIANKINSGPIGNENSEINIKNDFDIEENELVSKENDAKLYEELKKEDSATSSSDQNLANTEEIKINDIENERNKLFDVLPQKLNTKDILKQEDKMLKSCNKDSLTLRLLLSDHMNTFRKISEDIRFRNLTSENDQSQNDPTSQNTHFHSVPTQNGPMQNIISQNFHPQNVHFPNNLSENVPSQKVECPPQNWYPVNSATNQRLANKINSGPTGNENANINIKNDFCIEENELVSTENDAKLYEELKNEGPASSNNKMDVDEANMDIEKNKIISDENHLKLYEFLKAEPKTPKGTMEVENFSTVPSNDMAIIPTQNVPIQNVISQKFHPQNDHFPNNLTQNILSQKVENSLFQNVLSQNVLSRNDTCQNTNFQNVHFSNNLSENVVSQKVESPTQNWYPLNSSTNKRLENENITNKINSGPIGNENSEINIKKDISIEENKLIFKENVAKLYEELKKEDSATPNNKMDIEENKIISDNIHSELYELLKTKPKPPKCTIEKENYSTVPSNGIDIEENMPPNEISNSLNKELKIENEEQIDDEQTIVDIEENSLKFEQIDKDLYEEIKTSDEFIITADGNDDEIIKCDYCEKRLPKRTMYFHLLVHNRYLCKICKILCKNSDQLRSHHTKVHNYYYKYQCKVCKKKYNSKVFLKSHELTHSSELPFKCDKCNKTFGFEYILKLHMKQHDDSEKKFACLVCDKRFVLSCHLSAHMKQHTHVKRTAWECNICGKIFPRSGNLVQHQHIHKGEKTFECPTCGKKFLMHTHLKQHLPIHMDVKEFSCHICQKGFRDKSSLKRHIETHDKKRKTKRTEKKEKRKEAIEESSENEAQDPARDKEENDESSEFGDKSLKRNIKAHDKKKKRKERRKKLIIESSESENEAQDAVTDKEENDEPSSVET